MTGSMERALAEMTRRRRLQLAYNERHGITPTSIVKSMEQVKLTTRVADARTVRPEPKKGGASPADLRDPVKRAAAIAAIEGQMKEAASNLEFELAALLRDQLTDLKAQDAPTVQRERPARARRRA
jgi:excinuclease ABC subunit B